MIGVLYLMAIFNFIHEQLENSLLRQKVIFFFFLAICQLSVFTGEIVDFYLASHQVAKHKTTRYFPGEYHGIFIRKTTCAKKVTIWVNDCK